jgi:hypothetical protein
MHTKSKPSTRSPARSKVVETIDHGAVAVHLNRPFIAVLLVQLPDTEEEHHAPMPAILQGGVKLGAGSLKEQGLGNEEDIVYPHLLVDDACTH